MTRPRKNWNMKASRSAPRVGHHRPRTRRKDRRRAPVPRTPSATSTGNAIDHDTPSQTNGMNNAADRQDEAAEHEEGEPDEGPEPPGRRPEGVPPVRRTAEVGHADRPEHGRAGDQEGEGGERLGGEHAGQPPGQGPGVEGGVPFGVEVLEPGVRRADRGHHQRRQDLERGHDDEDDAGQRRQVPAPDLDGHVDDLADRERPQVGHQHGRQRIQPARSGTRKGRHPTGVPAPFGLRCSYRV